MLLKTHKSHPGFKSINVENDHVQIYYLGELLVVDGGGWLGSGFANLLAWVQSSGGRGAGVEPKTDALMFF